MQLSVMVTEVENIVQDPSFTSDDIKSYLNLALDFAAQQVPLPNLKRIGTIETAQEQAWVSLAGLSGGFSGRLRKCFNSTGNEIEIYPTLDLLLIDYAPLTSEGAVEAVALEGTILWYQKIPESPETLTLLYYQNPGILTADGDEPADYPEFLHKLLFVHGAAFMLFDRIEDGVEGEKINTRSNFWQSFDENNKGSGIIKLREWVAQRRVHHISSRWSN